MSEESKVTIVVTKQEFAIFDYSVDSWVAGCIEDEGPFAYPLIMGLKAEREIYPSRKDAQMQLDRTCSIGQFEIIEV